MKKLILVSLLMLSGCSANLEAYALKNSISKCEPHGGIMEIYYAGFSWYVKCMDGAIFYNIDKRPTT